VVGWSRWTTFLTTLFVFSSRRTGSCPYPLRTPKVIAKKSKEMASAPNLCILHFPSSWPPIACLAKEHSNKVSLVCSTFAFVHLQIASTSIGASELKSDGDLKRTYSQLSFPVFSKNSVKITPLKPCCTDVTFFSALAISTRGPV
jgi:hypothetical protein